MMSMMSMLMMVLMMMPMVMSLLSRWRAAVSVSWRWRPVRHGVLLFFVLLVLVLDHVGTDGANDGSRGRTHESASKLVGSVRSCPSPN